MNDVVFLACSQGLTNVCLGQVGKLENVSQNSQILQFLTFWSKKSQQAESKNICVKVEMASYLLRFRSTIGSGQGPSLDQLNDE